MKLTDEQIGIELRALRETPSERFASELDRRAGEGFPTREGERDSSALGERIAARLAPLRRGRLLPALAAGGTAVVVIGIAVAQSGPDQDDPERAVAPDAPIAAEGTGEEGAAGAGASRAEPLEAAPSGDEPGAIAPPSTAVPPAPPSDQELKPGQPRVRERSASMTLSTEPDEVGEVADGVVDVVDRYEGIVVSSNVSTADGKGRASFDLRIPTANLQAALADLSDLASVASRNEGVLDITAPFVGAEERFEDAKAEVDALLEELGEADSASEIASIREQLRAARFELAGARAELGALKQRADFSQLSVSIVGDGDADGWSLGDALDDALGVLEDLAGAALVALAVIVPLGGTAALVWLGLSAFRRRRREKALD